MSMNNDNKQKNTLSFLESWSGKSTRWIGSTQSLVLHTVIFGIFFWLGYTGHDWEKILLVLTTLVSLEAIYLSIFIQMSINRNTESLEDVEEGLDEIQEDVDEIQENVDEIQDDVEEIQEDIDEIQDDVEEITAEEEPQLSDHQRTHMTLEKIEKNLQKLMDDFHTLQKQKEE